MSDIIREVWVDAGALAALEERLGVQALDAAPDPYIEFQAPDEAPEDHVRFFAE